MCAHVLERGRKRGRRESHSCHNTFSVNMLQLSSVPVHSVSHIEREREGGGGGGEGERGWREGEVCNTILCVVSQAEGKRFSI